MLGGAAVSDGEHRDYDCGCGWIRLPDGTWWQTVACAGHILNGSPASEPVLIPRPGLLDPTDFSRRAGTALHLAFGDRPVGAGELEMCLEALDDADLETLGGAASSLEDAAHHVLTRRHS